MPAVGRLEKQAGVRRAAKEGGSHEDRNCRDGPPPATCQHRRSLQPRKERIRTTLLGTDDGAIRCPRIVRVGLAFEVRDPVEVVSEILYEEGYGSPEDLRSVLAIPDHALIARPWSGSASMVDPNYGKRRDVLWNALVLGLCTAQVYDPARPVLWTQASITRRLELFDPRGAWMCTAQVYDPARPVLWTQSSLTRRLELFDPAGFYA